MTTRTILASTNELQRLGKLGLITVLKAKQIRKAAQAAQNVLTEFERDRLEVVKKYDVGDKTEKDVPPDVWAKFQAEFKELLDEDHALSEYPVQIPASATGLTPDDVAVLEDRGFIVVVEK